MHTDLYKKVMFQLSEAIKFDDADALANGTPLILKGRQINFFFDDVAKIDAVSVYVDMGALPDDELSALRGLMKLNFRLASGGQGGIALHPETNRVFFVFRYLLTADASGQELLDLLVRAVTDVQLEAAK